MLRRRSLDRCCAAVQSYTHAWRRAHATVSEQAKSVLARFELKSEDAKGTLPEPPALEARLGFLKSIGVPSVANAVRRHPPLVHYAVEDMKPRLEYLLSLGIHEVGPMVERAPLLLGCDITRDLQRKVVILQTLGLKKVAKWVSRNPELVHVDLEEDMRPVVVLLRSVHGLKLPRVLPLLGWWHYKDVAGLQAQLDFIAGLVGADKLGAVVSKNARLLTATRANIELKAGLQPNNPWPASPPRSGPTHCAAPCLAGRVSQVGRIWRRRRARGQGAKPRDDGARVSRAQAPVPSQGHGPEHRGDRELPGGAQLQPATPRDAARLLEKHGVTGKPLGRMYRSSHYTFCTKLAKQPLQYLDGTPGEPPSAAETWLFKNVADKAASRERGLAVEEMRRVIMQAATPSPGVDAAVVGAPASTSIE